LFWRSQTRKPCFSPLKQPSAVWAIAFSPDGKQLVLACADLSIPLFAVPSLMNVGSLKGNSRPVRCMSFSADGQRLATGDTHGDVIVWNTATAQVLARLPDPDHSVSGVAFTADGRRVVSAGGHLIRVWDIESSHEAFRLPGHTGLVRSLAISPDGGRRLASASDDGTVKIWDSNGASEDALIFNKGRAPANAVAFDRRGRLAVAEHSRLHVLERDSRRPICSWTLPDKNGATSLAFSPDGSR
jgi:WD40 repeat protein